MALNMAVRIESGLAASLPTISNPVPWSGDVLTTSKPAVKLTPEPKVSALNGMRP